MKGDFTRWTYNRKKHYREVNMQQGRVQLDADWNEQNSIDFHYETSALQDIIGRAGTPIDSSTGYSDGFQIRFTDLVVTPSSGTLTTQFIIDGYGFAAGEKVSFKLDGSSSTDLPSSKATPEGTITVTFTVPSSAMPGTFKVIAKGETSGNAADTSFDLTSGATLQMTPTSGATNQAIEAEGYGFAAGEKVTLVMTPNAGLSFSPLTVAADGTFISTIVFSSTTSPGTYTVMATGSTSGDTATADFNLTSNSLVAFPSSGPIGSQFWVSGYGFASGESIAFSLSGNTGLSIPSSTVGSDGTFNSSVTFPLSASPGTYTVTATGSTSGDIATAGLFILPYLPSLGFTIKQGHYYVDGILSENDNDVAFASQPDLPFFQGNDLTVVPGRGVYIVYLDVWERHLTYLDDPEMREVALLGPDTATRTKIVWQVKVLPVDLAPVVVQAPPPPPPPPALAGALAGSFDASSEFDSAESAALSQATDTTLIGEKQGIDVLGRMSPDPSVVKPCLTEFPIWTALTTPSTGKLTARAKPTEPTGDPCEVPDEAGYTSLQNQLYRVEVHNGGLLEKKSTAVPTFKWSRDNGIVVSAISDIDTSDSTATVLTVGSTGKNPNLSFLNNMWVEVTSDINDLWGLPGSLALVTAVNNPGQNTITIDPTSIVGSAITNADYPQGQNPKVRRWDWDQTEATPPPYPLIVKVPTDNDGYIELEDGVEVKFADGTYRTGDYWLIPARTATADVDWPEEVRTVDWSSVPAGGSDAKTLAKFLVERYGLDGIKASDFVLSGTTEIDGSYTDPSGVSHVLSIALNIEQTVGTLTVDGIVGAEIPVVTQADGSLTLQCGFPEALGPEGIDHYYARLALFEYLPRLELRKVCQPVPQTKTLEVPEGGALSFSISPSAVIIPLGETGKATVTVSYALDDKPGRLEGTLSVAVDPTGTTSALSTSTVSTSGPPVTSQLSVTIPSSLTTECYVAKVTFLAKSEKMTLTAMTYLGIFVPLLFVSPIRLLTDCRNLFPALTDLPRLFYVSGDGQTANADYSLPSPLMAAAWSGRVRFTIVKGTGTLTNSDAAGSPAQGLGGFLDVMPGSTTPDPLIYPDLAHVAWCTWVIDQSTPVQIVRAEKLDSDGHLTDSSPIYYNAVLPGGGSQPAAPSAAASATTGIINVALQPGSAQLLGPFNHFLAVKTPPAILLALEAQYAGLPGGAMDIMAEANYTILATDKAAGSLDLSQIPIAAAYDITTQSFSVQVLNPAGADADQLFKLRWWAIPANTQTAQNAPGVVLTPGWVAANSATPVDISGAYFDASAQSITVSYSQSGGASVNIQTFSPVTSSPTYGGAFDVPSFSVPSGLSGWVQITATDGTSSPSATLYVVRITATTAGTFPNLTVTVSGSGFAPYGPAIIQLDNVTVTTSHAVETDASGSFASAEFKTPASLTSGTHTVSATIAGAIATTTFTAAPPAGAGGLGEKPTVPGVGGAAAARAVLPAQVATNAPARQASPQLTLSIPTGTVGSDVAISGTGFSPNSKVALAFNQKLLPEATTNAQGSFIEGLKVPQTGSGNHLILARDESTGKTVSATFKVP
ncbi:MAG: DUF6519 domain-containing protein [Thaumarchaeota archaeon]|nr:DUF6519 domain-containing protein [Nitrososphaerota archaeon]